MREILFRGKRKDNGEWVEGYYVCIRYKHIHRVDHLITDLIGTSHVVDPETIGQYTGLTDKNGKKIFEGDIVKLQMPGYEMDGQIIFEEATFYIMEGDVREVLWYEEAKFEVIGTIHDDPALLEPEGR